MGFLLLRGWRGGLDLDSVNRVLEKDDEWESVDIKYVLVTTVGKRGYHDVKEKNTIIVKQIRSSERP